MKNIKRYLSAILMIIAAMIWGFAFSAQKAAENVSPFTLGAMRSLFAFIFLIFVILFFDIFLTRGVGFFLRKRKLI